MRPLHLFAQGMRRTRAVCLGQALFQYQVLSEALCIRGIWVRMVCLNTVGSASSVDMYQVVTCGILYIRKHHSLIVDLVFIT
jgi:hypothetical protein